MLIKSKFEQAQTRARKKDIKAGQVKQWIYYHSDKQLHSNYTILKSNKVLPSAIRNELSNRAKTMKSRKYNKYQTNMELLIGWMHFFPIINSNNLPRFFTILHHVTRKLNLVTQSSCLQFIIITNPPSPPWALP